MILYSDLLSIAAKMWHAIHPHKNFYGLEESTIRKWYLAAKELQQQGIIK